MHTKENKLRKIQLKEEEHENSPTTILFLIKIK